MTRTLFGRWSGALGSGALAAALGWTMASTAGAAPATQLLIDDTRVFPESLTSTAAGDVIIGSSAKGTIYRAAPGADKATVWIDPIRYLLGSSRSQRAFTICSPGTRPPS